MRWRSSNINLVKVFDRHSIRHILVIRYYFVRTELVMNTAGHFVEDEVVYIVNVVVRSSEDGAVVVGAVVHVEQVGVNFLYEIFKLGGTVDRVGGLRAIVVGNAVFKRYSCRTIL